MKNSASDNIFVDVSKLKKLYIRIIVAEVTYYCGVLVLWAVFYMNTIHPWWLLVPTIPVLATRVRFFYKKMVCPNCNARLVDDENSIRIGRSCEHCGVQFR
jgi:uncharacterized protein with PIN domain